MFKTIGNNGVNVFLVIHLLFVLQATLFAGENNNDQKKDSLLLLLEISPEQVKSKIYYELSDLAMEKDTFLAKNYARKALEFAKRFQAPYDLSISHYQLGRILFFQDSLESALIHIKQSLVISQKHEGNSETVRAYMNLSGKSLFYKAGIYHKLYRDSVKVVLKDFLKALEILSDSDHYKMLAEINQQLGHLYFQLNMYEEGIKYFENALKYYRICDDKQSMAQIYTTLAFRVDRATGIEYCQKAIDLFAEANDSLGMALSFIHISYSARHILDTETSLAYLQLAYDIYKKYNDYPRMVYTLFHLSTFYSKEMNDPVAELQYLKKGADIALTHKVIKNAGHLFITLGTYYKMKYNFDSAAYYYHIADSITAFMPGKPERIRYLVRMGDMQSDLKFYEEAEKYLRNALEQARKIDDWQLIEIAFHALYQTFKRQGKFQEALNIFEQYRDLQNEMANHKVESRIAESQIRYETEKIQYQLAAIKKDQQIKNQQLRKNQITIASISAILFLILAFSVLIVRQLIRKHRAYNQLMEKNILLLKCENPVAVKLKARNKNQPEIDPETQEQILRKIKYQIGQKKVFLKKDITLNGLAKKCQTNSSYLSKIIHNNYDSNFSAFINGLRIKEAQKLMADEKYRSYSIEGIASSVGFKTKSVFNASFKKITGVTPSYYLEYLTKRKS